MEDLEEVGLVEQAELDRAVVNKGLDLGSTQRRDPVELGGGDVFAKAGGGQHAPVAH